MAVGGRKGEGPRLSSGTSPVMVVLIVAAAAGILYAAAGRPSAATGQGRQSFKVPQAHVENVRFETVAGETVTVYYDLVADNPKAFFEVTLWALPPGGKGAIRAKSVTGDVGTGVQAGAGKKIVWEAGRDVESLRLDQFQFDVRAVAGPVAGVPDAAGKPKEEAARSQGGALVLATEPPGATVLVDGSARGTTPVKLADVSAGKHQVHFVMAGYLENNREIEVTAGEIQNVQVTLTPATTGTAPKGGGSTLKWILPIAGGGAAVAVYAATRKGEPTTTMSTTSVSPCATAPAIQVTGVQMSPDEVGLESITSFAFTAQGIAGCSPVGIAWDFGDGTTSSGANVGSSHVATHTYTRSGTFSVRATVTDARPSSASASRDGVRVSNMTASWTNTFDNQLRTFTLTQTGAQLTGTYTNSGLPGVTASVTGSVGSPKTITITASGSGITPITVTGTIAPDLNSFTGLVTGGGASGQNLMFSRR